LISIQKEVNERIAAEGRREEERPCWGPVALDVAIRILLG
jgi:hypothetical protein